MHRVENEKARHNKQYVGEKMCVLNAIFIENRMREYKIVVTNKNFHTNGRKRRKGKHSFKDVGYTWKVAELISVQNPMKLLQKVSQLQKKTWNPVEYQRTSPKSALPVQLGSTNVR